MFSNLMSGQWPASRWGIRRG